MRAFLFIALISFLAAPLRADAQEEWVNNTRPVAVIGTSPPLAQQIIEDHMCDPACNPGEAVSYIEGETLDLDTAIVFPRANPDLTVRTFDMLILQGLYFTVYGEYEATHGYANENLWLKAPFSKVIISRHEFGDILPTERFNQKDDPTIACESECIVANPFTAWFLFQAISGPSGCTSYDFPEGWIVQFPYSEVMMSTMSPFQIPEICGQIVGYKLH